MMRTLIITILFTSSINALAGGFHWSDPGGNTGGGNSGGGNTGGGVEKKAVDVLTTKEYAKQKKFIDGLTSKDAGTAVLGYRIYTRGNDDNREKDNQGVSNFRTAQMLTALQTETKSGKTKLKLKYHFELTTDEVQALIIARNFRVGETENSMTKKPEGEGQIAIAEVARDKDKKITAGSTCEATVDLGNVPLDKDGKYSGVAQVNFAPTGRAFPRDQKEGQQQTIKWSVEVKDGKIISSNIEMAHKGTVARSAAEMLKLVGSSKKETFDLPHPRKNGAGGGSENIG